MQKLIRGLAVLLVLFAIVVYARDCRLSFNQWKHCGAERGQPGLLGDWVHFEWRPSGLFSDILYVDGKPAARLVKYHFRVVDDVIEIVSLDGAETASYCGK
jgi:hypothetical protein